MTNILKKDLPNSPNHVADTLANTRFLRTATEVVQTLRSPESSALLRSGETSQTGVPVAEVLDKFLGDILTEASFGKVTTRGVPEAKTGTSNVTEGDQPKTKSQELTPRDLTYQLTDFAAAVRAAIAEGDQSKIAGALRYVPSAGGMRQAFDSLLQSKETALGVLEAIERLPLPETVSEKIIQSEMAAQAISAANGTVQAEGSQLSARQTASSPESQPVMSATEEVNNLSYKLIHVQRAIKEYSGLLWSADKHVKVNGRTGDEADWRRQAEQRIHDLPSHYKELAKRYHAEQKPWGTR